MTSPLFSRRQMLRAGAVTLALPWLGSLVHAADPAAAKAGAPKRMVNICANFGFYGPSFFPEKTGRDYQDSEYSALFADLRDRFTIFSGIAHPR